MTEKAKRVTWIERLEALNPCSEALNYARAKRSLAEAWRDCERADWMLWLLGWTEAGPPESPRRRTLAGCVADVVAPALRHVHEKERRPALAIREVRRWARNDPRATLETLAAAWAAADNAAEAAADNAAEAAAEGAAEDAAWTAAESSAAAAAWTAADNAAEGAAGAAMAARAAGAASWAAMAAADNAAKAVAWAAEADAWAAAKAATLKYMTAIVRRHYPKPPRLPR